MRRREFVTLVGGVTTVIDRFDIRVPHWAKMG